MTTTATDVACRVASSAADLAAHHEIRHSVFVVEQHVFDGSDRDENDAAAAAVHVLGTLAGRPAGAVRLFPLGEGRWQGDRLCVLPPFRTFGIGGPLVRFAVASAAVRGGTVMRAHIQLPNVHFFERLGWRADGPVEQYADLPHQPMSIDLPETDAANATLAALTPR